MEKKFDSKNVFYYSIDGKLVREKIEFDGFLNFLYTNFLGKFLRKILSRKIVANFCAKYQSSIFSKKNILPFIKEHNIDLEQFEEDISEFKSFNDFFIRKLKSGARKIAAGANIFISPADSKLFVIPNIEQDSQFIIKKENFTLEKFLNNDKLAQDYKNGLMMIFRLAPYDYHRFHFPYDGIACEPIKINGIYESVNPIAYKNGVQPLIENKRDIIILNTKEFSDLALVSVGAMFVGSIIYTYSPGKFYKKGSEIGYFQFGGSTIVLLFKQGVIKPKEIFLKNSVAGFETEVRMGQTINE